MPYVAVDIEATGLVERGVYPSIWCVSVVTGKSEQVLPWSESTRVFLNELFTTHTPVFHNAAYDVPVLVHHGVNVPYVFDDTMVMAWVWNPNNPVGYSLKNQAMENNPPEFWKAEAPEVWTEYNEYMGKYCIQDSKATLALHTHYMNLFVSDQRAYKLYREIEQPYIWSIIEYEATGVYIDRYKLQRLLEIKGRHVVRLDGYIHKMFPEYPKPVDRVLKKPARSLGLNKCRLEYLGEEEDGHHYRVWEPFNMASADHVAWGLIQQGWKPTTKTASGKPATGKDVLCDVSLPLARLVTLCRSANHTINTYLKPYEEYLSSQNILYGSFGQCRAPTGRVAGSNPNLMAMDGSLKKLVVTPDYERVALFSGDLSQIEPRILAWYLHTYMRDDELMDAFLAGIDYHTHNAEKWGVKRRVAKTLALAISYGTGIGKVASMLKIPFPEAKRQLNIVKDATITTTKLKDSIVKHARLHGGVIHTILGRRLFYPDLLLTPSKETNDKIKYAERQVFNAIFQGGCADILKHLSVKAQAICRTHGARIVLPVHDELVGYVPRRNADEFCAAMNELFSSCDVLKPIPIKVNFQHGTNWHDLH